MRKETKQKKVHSNRSNVSHFLGFFRFDLQGHRFSYTNEWQKLANLDQTLNFSDFFPTIEDFKKE